MIPNAPRTPLLHWIARYCADTKRSPTFDEIERAANFRVRGGLGRCLEALEEVGQLQLAESSKWPGVAQTATTATNATRTVWSDAQARGDLFPPDEPGQVGTIIITQAQLRESIRKALERG